MKRAPKTEMSQERSAVDEFLDLFDVLGRRWSLRIMWELRSDALSFRSLRARAGGMSSAVLTDRLRELREAGLVTHETVSGYRLTGLGLDVAANILNLFTTLAARADWPSPSMIRTESSPGDCPWTDK